MGYLAEAGRFRPFKCRTTNHYGKLEGVGRFRRCEQRRHLRANGAFGRVNDYWALSRSPLMKWQVRPTSSGQRRA